MKTIAITALKGGTGKSVITFNIAALLATKFKKKILIIDLDPQHNMSNLLFKTAVRSIRSTQPKSKKQPNELALTREYTSEDIFNHGLESFQIIHKTHIPKLDIIPTTIAMTAVELQLTGMAGRELVLKNWIEDNREDLEAYDYIFFDCNPTMSIVNINAYIICDSVVLISDIDIDGIEAVGTFLELYYPIQIRIDRRAKDNIKGLIINKRDDTTKITKDFIEHVYSDKFTFDDILLKNNIHKSTAISETKVHRDPINSRRDERSYTELINIIDEMTERGIL
jgi:chromosome partitioning protein